MMAKAKRVLLVEISDIVIAGIVPIVESTGEFKVVSTISSLGRHKISALDYDIMIVNPASDGLEIMEKLAQGQDRHRVVLLAHESYPKRITGMFSNLISLYDSKARILKILRDVLVERNDARQNDELSLREKEILTAVAKGMTNKEIADAFNISINTVMTHRRNISAKLGINTISGLTVYAVINKLIEI